MCACVSCAWSAGVRACYDEGKRVAETLFFDFHRQHKIEVRVARIFNTFGPGMHPYGETRREEREKVYRVRELEIVFNRGSVDVHAVREIRVWHERPVVDLFLSCLQYPRQEAEGVRVCLVCF